MPDKDRLYICLYARGGKAKMAGLEDTYHWAFLLGPKIEGEGKTGFRYHAKEKLGPEGFEWTFEKRETTLEPTAMLLVRILVAKVKDNSRVDAVLHKVPICTTSPGWNCVDWVKEALRSLDADDRALGTSATSWSHVRDTALRYCQQKKDEGRFQVGKYNAKQAPTYDLLEDREMLA